jgi:prepilin peptidase CpaA
LKSATILHLVPLFAMLAWAAVTDVRDRKIRNWLTFTLMITGLIQSLTVLRTVNPGSAFLGMLCGFGLTFLLFAIGALGGGDVKLLTGVGAWLGPLPTLLVFFAAALAGMVIVIVQAIWQRRLFLLLRNTATVAVNVAHVRTVGVAHLKVTEKSCRTVQRPLPYAVPVLFGVCAVVARGLYSAWV